MKQSSFKNCEIALGIYPAEPARVPATRKGEVGRGADKVASEYTKMRTYPELALAGTAS